MTRELEQGIKVQHEEYMRSGYDGHNRRSIITTMDALRKRRGRRRWNRRLKDAVLMWNSTKVSNRKEPS